VVTRLTLHKLKAQTAVMNIGIPFPDLSPNLFSLSVGGIELALRWYALAYIVGILLGWRLSITVLTRPTLWAGNAAPMTPKALEDLLTWIILGVLIGGRTGFVLFYQPSYFSQYPVEAFYIWQGGMAFHGGFAGVVIAVWLFSWHRQISLSGVADVIALAAPIGLFLGRLANFINAELWGRATELPWGVIFPGAAAQNCGQPIGLMCARHPSQLYEAALEGLILGSVLLWMAFRRQGLAYPWRMTGVFLAGYGLSRFVVEFVRQPDPQFISLGNPLGLAWHVNGWGMTMGQTLSLPMLIVGLILLTQRKKT
jgi:phosphatidylglycerol:prolipoprotein diacylglycerol transferase